LIYPWNLYPLDSLVAAAYSREKLARLEQGNLALEQLRFLLRLSHDLRHLNTRGYEYATGLVDEIGRLIGGWIKQPKGLEEREH